MTDSLEDGELAAGVARLLTRARGAQVEAPDTVIRHRWSRDPHIQVGSGKIFSIVQKIFTVFLNNSCSVGTATLVWARL